MNRLGGGFIPLRTLPITPTVASNECDEKAEVALYTSKLVTWISSDMQNAIRNILRVFLLASAQNSPRVGIAGNIRTQHKRRKAIALSMSWR